jgi:hypothetical protein
MIFIDPLRESCIGSLGRSLPFYYKLVVTRACKARHDTDVVQQWKMPSDYHTGYAPLT